METETRMPLRKRQKRSVEVRNVLVSMIREIAAQTENPDLFFRTGKEALRETLLRAIAASAGGTDDQRYLIDTNLDTAIEIVVEEFRTGT